MIYKIEFLEYGAEIGSLRVWAATEEEAVRVLRRVFAGHRDAANFARLLRDGTNCELASVVLEDLMAA